MNRFFEADEDWTEDNKKMYSAMKKGFFGSTDEKKWEFCAHWIFANGVEIDRLNDKISKLEKELEEVDERITDCC